VDECDGPIGDSVADVLALEHDAPRVRSVHAGKDLDERGFASAISPSRASTSPRWIEMLTSRSACVPPNVLTMPSI
jgi:hypothetical protein